MEGISEERSAAKSKTRAAESRVTESRTAQAPAVKTPGESRASYRGMPTEPSAVSTTALCIDGRSRKDHAQSRNCQPAPHAQIIAPWPGRECQF